MSSRTPPPVDLLRQDEKEQRLRAFVTSCLGRFPTEEHASSARPPLLLIAQSMASPVAHCVVALGSELVLHGLAVRAIFTSLDPGPEGEDWAEATGAIAFDRCMRWARNPRLLEAHEQLILSPTAMWTGDSMRRDPMKRDAYEAYAPDSFETARLAQQCFERIWAASEPYPAVMSGELAPSLSGMPAIDVTIRGAFDPEDPLAALRHH